MRGSLLKAKGSLPLRAKITTDFINLVPVLWTKKPMKINKNNFLLHSRIHSSYYFFIFFRAILSKCHRAIQNVILCFCVCPMKPNFSCVFLIGMKCNRDFRQTWSCFMFSCFKNIEGNTTLCCYFWHTIWCCIQFINIYYIYSIFI